MGGAATWIFVWFIQRIQLKNAVLVPLIGIMFGNVLGGITNFITYKFEVTQQLTIGSPVAPLCCLEAKKQTR